MDQFKKFGVGVAEPVAETKLKDAEAPPEIGDSPVETWAKEIGITPAHLRGAGLAGMLTLALDFEAGIPAAEMKAAREEGRCPRCGGPYCRWAQSDVAKALGWKQS